MSDVVISVENISKEYRLGALSHHSLIMDLQSWWAKRCGKEDPNSKISLSRSALDGEKTDSFLALQDVSFEIKRGDLVGIIGRNGAGKSTLLKILSRVTTPTRGLITIKGRVASLLEVGTGFHPELTGRENVFLNGAILGMSKKEIRLKFDEIVAFSEVEEFIDTPVKRYSSGMYVRLAFGVAAHLEPEILIVDEVLAVGDAAFQKKCLGKMKEVGKGGRTVLFVSHSMATMEHLCKTALCLQKGEVIARGNAHDVVVAYEQQLFSLLDKQDLPVGVLYHNKDINIDEFHFLELSITDMNGVSLVNPKTYSGIRWTLRFHSPRELKNGSIYLFLKTLNGITILHFGTRPDMPLDMDFKKGNNSITCILPKLPLPAGTYIVGAGLAIPMKEWLLLNEQLCCITIGEADVFNSGFPPVEGRMLSVTDYSWERG
jgi:lipopolysaccharide transport system ATP-binding protein